MEIFKLEMGCPMEFDNDSQLHKSFLGVILESVIHSLEEGNACANLLTNYAFSFAGEFIFNNFNEMPSKIKTTLNHKARTPNIRKTTKDS